MNETTFGSWYAKLHPTTVCENDQTVIKAVTITTSKEGRRVKVLRFTCPKCNTTTEVTP